MNGTYDAPVRIDTGYRARVAVALETVRLWRRMTQEEVAVAADTSVSTISRYEGGLTAVQGHTMVRLARALRVPLDLLMDPPASREEVLIAVALHDSQRNAARPEPS